ncbi:MAG TPA: hypothetical protein PKH56_12265, partial [Saprospiraceae bacterium]|nr:hypothetical protein [Saprospiraceae bacterium]
MDSILQARKSKSIYSHLLYGSARILQYRTNLQYHPMSIEAIRTALVHTQLSKLRDKTNNKLYGL